MSANNANSGTGLAWLGGIAAVITSIAALVAAFHPTPQTETASTKRDPPALNQLPRPTPTPEADERPAPAAVEARDLAGFWYLKGGDFFISISPNNDEAPGKLSSCDPDADPIMLREAKWDGQALTLSYKQPDETSVLTGKFAYSANPKELVGSWSDKRGRTSPDMTFLPGNCKGNTSR